MTADQKDAEIARLRQQWDDHDNAWSERVAVLTDALHKAEAERDAALVLVAGAYEAAADHCWNKRDLLADAEKKQVEAGLTGRDYYGRRLEAELLSRSIHNLTPADALAARDRRDAQMRAEGRKEGLREAAGITLSHRERWRCAGGFEGHATGAKLIRDAILAAAEKEAGNG